MSLEAGLEHAFEFRVEGDLLTDVGGALATPVLATPRMIGVMERCSVLAVAEVTAGDRVVGTGTHERRLVPTR